MQQKGYIKKPMVAGLVLAAAMCPGMQAVAQGDDGAVMEEVVVSASRVEEKKREVTGNITVISREEITQAPGRTVGDILVEKGVGHIQKYPGSLTAIGIRGFRTDTHGNDLQGHVLVLLDGRRAGTGNVAKLLTENVERIEIIRGPGAVQYGSGGMGGVVNIITRRGTGSSLAVEAGGGNAGRGQAVVEGTAKRGAVDFSGSVVRRIAGDYETGSGRRYRNTGFESETGLSTNLGYEVQDGHRLGLVVTAFDADEAGSPGYFAANDFDDFTDKSNISVDGVYEGRSRSGHVQWLLRSFAGRDENSWYDPPASDPDGWDSGTPSGNTTDQLGGQAQISVFLGDADVTAGFDWVDYQVENTWSPQETGYVNPALFALGKYTLFSDQLILTGGIRHDWYRVEVDDGQGDEASDSHLTPQVGVAWPVSETLKLRTQYARAFVMPSANQLAIDMHSFGHRTVGNPDLKPEESGTWEAGIDYERGGLTASLTGFSSRFEDKIVTTMLADGSSSWKNLGEASIEGVELSAGYDIGELFDWSWEVRPSVDLTWLTELRDESSGGDLLYVSGTTIAAGLEVASAAGTSFHVAVTYCGPQDIENWQSGMYPAPIVELDGFTVTNISLRYPLISLQFGDLLLRGTVANVFDEDYAYVNGYPMPGQTFYLGLQWRY